MEDKTVSTVQSERDILCGEIQKLVDAFYAKNPKTNLVFNIEKVTKEISGGRKLQLPTSVRAQILID